MENKQVRHWWDTDTKRIRFWWDMDNADNIGWFVVVEIGRRHITDSMMIDFPVDVDQFELEDRDALQSALQDAYPDFKIDQEGLNP